MSVNTALGYRTALADAVRAEFSRRGIHRTELAAVIGKSRPTAYNRLKGVTPFDSDEIDKIAAFLGMTAYELNTLAEQGARFVRETPTELVVETAERDPWAKPERAKRSAS